MEDWNKRKNELTLKLFEAGYTPDNHPDYAKWIDYMHEFEYTTKFLEGTVWEAPCGVLRKGEFTHGYMSFAGVDWRAENDNYNFHCPYRKKECELWHPLLKGLNGIVAKCSWHITDKPYDYENSAEKLDDEKNQLIRLNLQKKFGNPSMVHCACCNIDEETCEPYFKYDPEDCLRFMNNGCDNEVCYCTGKKRNLTRANVYYDVKTTTEYCNGFITEPVVKIKKGVKLFESNKAMTDLEMYLKANPDAPLQRERHKKEHTTPLFFAEYHGQKYELEILNVRIERRESRDLLQDLQDAREGIEVIHASDMIKRQKEAKRERKEKRNTPEAKAKKIIKNLGEQKVTEILGLLHEGYCDSEISEMTGVGVRYIIKILKIEGIESVIKANQKPNDEAEQLSFL